MPSRTFLPSGKDILLLGALLSLAIFLMWSVTGTLAPYGNTLSSPRVIPPCDYLVNLDHNMMYGSFRFLDGAPPEKWANNHMLRRMLHPVLAYPFTSRLGYEFGGFIANLLIHIVAITFFFLFILKRYGRLSALVSTLALITYPGLAYWVGLPYPYAMIVPCYLLGFILLLILYEQESFLIACVSALGIGVLSLGYDMIAFFAPTALLLLLYQRRWLTLIPVVSLIVLPNVAAVLFFKFLYGISPSNPNTSAYGAIISSYLSPPEFELWAPYFRALPELLFYTFFASNFFTLPILFCITLVLALINRKAHLKAPEGAFLLTALTLFLFVNAAPYYHNRWQLRGDWIARIYQPIFVVFLFYLARVLQEFKSNPKTLSTLLGVIGLTVLCNLTIVVGPLFGYLTPAEYAYYHFYKHSRLGAFTANIAKYGRRPFGFCENQ